MIANVNRETGNLAVHEEFREERAQLSAKRGASITVPMTISLTGCSVSLRNKVCVPGMATSEPHVRPEIGIAQRVARSTRRGSGAQAWEARATGLALGVTILRDYGSQNSLTVS